MDKTFHISIFFPLIRREARRPTSETWNQFTLQKFFSCLPLISQGTTTSQPSSFYNEIHWNNHISLLPLPLLKLNSPSHLTTHILPTACLLQRYSNQTNYGPAITTLCWAMEANEVGFSKTSINIRAVEMTKTLSSNSHAIRVSVRRRRKRRRRRRRRRRRSTLSS
jgi:hypothetical protein